MEGQAECRGIGFPCIGWALWAGLVGGLAYSIVANSALFIEGDIVSHVRIRLQAAAFTTLCYALVFCVVMAAVGLLVALVTLLIHRPVSRSAVLGGCFGFLTAVLLAMVWLHRIGLVEMAADNPNRLVAVVACSLVSAAAGIGVGLMSWRLAIWWSRGPAQRRPFLSWVVRWGVPLILLGVLLLLAALGLYRALRSREQPGSGTATAERPNIILITVDTLRPDHLGAYGYDSGISPHIDALAEQGVVFRNAVAQSSWTLPSVASTVTSMYPTELGTYSWRSYREYTQSVVDPLRTTLAEALQQAGYHTEAYVTNAWITEANGFDQGFDRFVGVRLNEPFDWNSLSGRPLFYWLKRLSPALHRWAQQGYDALFDPRLHTHDSGPLVDEYAIQFLRSRREEPFFLWLYYIEPHTIYWPPSPFPALPAGTTEEQFGRLRTRVFWDLVDAGPGWVRPGELPILVSLYDGEIHSVDRCIGEITAELERLGLSDNTLVVLHSDHGEEFMEHGGYAHGRTLYGEVVHVPLILSGAGVTAAGQAVDTPVGLVDVMPTLLEVAGAAQTAEGRGRSLLPALQGQELANVPQYSEMIYTLPLEQKAIRYGDYQLIYSVEDGAVELYDLRSDPRAQVDLAGTETEVAGEYLALLRGWLAGVLEAAESLPRSEGALGAQEEQILEMLRRSGY